MLFVSPLLVHCGATPLPPEAVAVKIAERTLRGAAGVGQSAVELELERRAAAEVPPSEPLAHFDEMPDVRFPLELTLRIQDIRDADELGIWSVEDDGPVLELHASSCRFADAEPFWTASESDRDGCIETNRTAFEDRTQVAIRVPSGDARVRIVNQGVGRPVGLWIRPTEDPGVTVLSVGGVADGEAREFEISLEPGTYLYSCPLNPTPDYLLMVE